MDHSLDCGPILVQEPIALADGITGAELERRCAQRGGQLFAQCLAALTAGEIPLRPQATGGSYEPWPTLSDFVITPDRPARWAFNFARVATQWGEPVVIAVTGRRFVVRKVLTYSQTESLEAPFRLAGDHLLVRCTPGVLDVSIDEVTSTRAQTSGRGAQAGRQRTAK
jgi:methionyl-tRNA formyltransferase